MTAGIEKGPIKKMKQKGDATPGCDVNSPYILREIGEEKEIIKNSLNTANLKWE